MRRREPIRRASSLAASAPSYAYCRQSGAEVRSVFQGPLKRQAVATFDRLIAEGYHPTGAAIAALIASYPDGWIFRKTIGQIIHRCPRQVQRWLSRFRDDGVMRVHRNKKGEIPRGADGPRDCGWSHRWIVGIELVGEQLKAAVAQAKARAQKSKLGRIIAQAMFPSSPEQTRPKSTTSTPPASRPRPMSVAELDAALEALEAERDERDTGPPAPPD